MGCADGTYRPRTFLASRPSTSLPRRSGTKRGYADYRELLDTEKPDVAAICPRHTNQHLEMVTAAAEAGAHI
jgi:predicted dehydrogenase